MSFGNRSLRYSRRPVVNIVGGRHGGGINVEDDDPNRKYCPRCQFNLYYFEERDIWFCGKCAWNFPDELTKKSHQDQQQQQQKEQQQQQEVGVKVAATTAADATTNKEQDLHVVSMGGTRSSQKKKDPFDYLRKDDAYLEKSGLSFVTDTIDFSDDRSTISSEELRKQNIRLRGKRIH